MEETVHGEGHKAERRVQKAVLCQKGSDGVLCQIGRILVGFLQGKKTAANWDSLFLPTQHMQSTGPVRTPDPDGLSSGLVEADHSLASLCSPPFAHPSRVC